MERGIEAVVGVCDSRLAENQWLEGINVGWQEYSGWGVQIECGSNAVVRVYKC